MNIRLQSSGKTLDHYEQMGLPRESWSLGDLLTRYRDACIEQQGAVEAWRQSALCPQCGFVRRGPFCRCRVDYR